MPTRMSILLIIFVLTLIAGWKYVYVPFSERETAKAQLEEILASRVKVVSFTPLLPKKLPSGFYLHAPELLKTGGKESLRIQYTKRDGSVLDIYERAVGEGEDIAFPFHDASHWQERKDVLLKGDMPAYFVRGKEEKLDLLINGKMQKVTLQMAMLGFSRTKTRVVISNSAFLEGTLLSEQELIEIAEAML